MSKEVGRGMNAAEDAMLSLYKKTPGAKPFVFDKGSTLEHTFVVGPTGGGMSVADYSALALTDAEAAAICEPKTGV